MARTKLIDYPELRATDAIDIAKKLVASFKSNPINMQAFAQATGYSLKSSGLHKKIADLKRYGLLDGRGDVMYASELAKRIGAQKDQKDYNEAVSEMAINIPLFKQLHEVFLANTNPQETDFFTQLLNITHVDQAELKPISEEIRKLYIDAVRYISMKTATTQMQQNEMPYKKATISLEPTLDPNAENVVAFRAKGIELSVIDDKEHLQKAKAFIEMWLESAKETNKTTKEKPKPPQ